MAAIPDRQPPSPPLPPSAGRPAVGAQPMGVGNVAADDRRGGDRRSIDGVLRLRVDSPHLDGKAENISDSGILFFTDRPLRVTVELEEDGVLRSRSGRLVRAQRIKGDTTGWAVEFDEQG